MKRLIALDQEEQNALMDLANAVPTYVPSYMFTINGLYVYGSEESEQVERLILLGARAGLVSP